MHLAGASVSYGHISSFKFSILAAFYVCYGKANKI